MQMGDMHHVNPALDNKAKGILPPWRFKIGSGTLLIDYQS